MTGNEGLKWSKIQEELDKKFTESLNQKGEKSVDTKNNQEKGEETFEQKKARLQEMENDLISTPEDDIYNNIIVHYLESSASTETEEAIKEMGDALDKHPDLFEISKLKFDVYLKERINAGDAKRVAILRKFEDFFSEETE